MRKRTLPKDYEFIEDGLPIKLLKGEVYTIEELKEDLTKVRVTGNCNIGEESKVISIIFSVSIARIIFRMKDFHSIECYDCHSQIEDESHYMIMILDDLWNSISNNNKIRLLCDKCIEARLGRSITWKDLKYRTNGKAIPANVMYLSKTNKVNDLIDYLNNQQLK